MTVCRYRNIPVGVLDQRLSSDARSLYSSIYTSPELHLCGVLFSTADRLAEMAGIESIWKRRRLARVHQAMRDLGEMVNWWPSVNVIFIPGFAMMQAANPNIWIGAMKNAANLPKLVVGSVQESIMRDFIEAVDDSKPYYQQTLEKLRKSILPITVAKPLPKPFRTVPETRAHVTRLPERAPARARIAEGSEGSEVADTSLSVHTMRVEEREREAV